ncbi:hypothetical protein ACHMWN_00100 [Pedobacter sp. UC225_61]|uniref:hypothetical protein n=1 Tax=Pedobacter sp. UC225_61 TaxID=3374623 RepID=UPI0037894523
MLKFIVFLLTISLLSVTVKAATGCVLNSNLTKIYTKKNGGASSTDYRTTNVSTALSGCVYAQTTTSCTVDGSGPGFLGDTTVLNCPIDDYVWLVLLFFGGFGFVHVRNKAWLNPLENP